MEKTTEESMESPSMMTYAIGAVLVVAVIAGAWYFRSKSNPATSMVEPTTGGEPVAVVASPTPGPISSLGCDQQYFNQKVGFNEYYLSVEGGDVSTAETVTCKFTASVDGKVVGSDTSESPLTAAPQRGGSTFRCTSAAIELEPNVPTVIDVTVTDDLDAEASCSGTFTFPM